MKRTVSKTFKFRRFLGEDDSMITVECIVDVDLVNGRKDNLRIVIGTEIGHEERPYAECVALELAHAYDWFDLARTIPE